MSSETSTIIELTPTYTLLSVRSLSTNLPILLNPYSQDPLWLLCLTKSSLDLLKKFHALNKNFHFPYHCLVFSNPESVQKKLSNSEKTEIYYIEKRFRENFYKALQIVQLPWIIALESGVNVYAAHDFPPDFTNLNSYKDPIENRDEEIRSNLKKLVKYKEQIQVLKKRIRKQERREVEYKMEIADMKEESKAAAAEIVELKKKVKEVEGKAAATPELENKKYLQGIKEKGNVFVGSKGVSDDIWRNEGSEVEYKGLEELTGTRELWISSLENKAKAQGHKAHVKLFPISKSPALSKINSSKETSNKRRSPEGVKISSRRYIY